VLVLILLPDVWLKAWLRCIVWHFKAYKAYHFVVYCKVDILILNVAHCLLLSVLCTKPLWPHIKLWRQDNQFIYMTCFIIINQLVFWDPPVNYYSIRQRQRSISSPKHSVSRHQLSWTLCIQLPSVLLPSPFSMHVWKWLLRARPINVSDIDIIVYNMLLLCPCPLTFYTCKFSHPWSFRIISLTWWSWSRTFSFHCWVLRWQSHFWSPLKGTRNWWKILNAVAICQLVYVHCLYVCLTVLVNVNKQPIQLQLCDTAGQVI